MFAIKLMKQSEASHKEFAATTAAADAMISSFEKEKA